MPCSFVPSGLSHRSRVCPRLTPRATFLRRPSTSLRAGFRGFPRYFRNICPVSAAGYNPAGLMQKIAILYDASQAVLSTFDLDEVLQRILVIARDYFHLQNVAILLLDKDIDQLCTRSQIGGEPGFENVRVSIGTGLIGSAAAEEASAVRARLRQREPLPAVGKENPFRAGDSAHGPRRSGGRARLPEREPRPL